MSLDDFTDKMLEEYCKAHCKQCKIEFLKETIRLEKLLNDEIRECSKKIEKYYPCWDIYDY